MIAFLVLISRNNDSAIAEQKNLLSLPAEIYYIPKIVISSNKFIIRGIVSMTMKVNKDNLIKELAASITYHHICADWWLHVSSTDEFFRNDMADHHIEATHEVRSIAIRFDILSKMYEEAYKIYDFRRTTSRDPQLDVAKIDYLHETFCKEFRTTRLYMQEY